MNEIKSHVVVQSFQKRLRFFVDWTQAFKVLDKVVQRYAEKGWPYNIGLVPQSDIFMPQFPGPREQANYFFILCLWMQGAAESDTGNNALKRMYVKEPELFEPKNYLDLSVTQYKARIKQMFRKLIKYGLVQRATENSEAWVYNLQKLARFWQSDARLLVNDCAPFDVIVERIIPEVKRNKKTLLLNRMDSPFGFRYFEKKMVAMIIYFLQDAKLILLSHTPMPVDFHSLRFFVTTSVIRVRGQDIKGTIGINFYKPQVMDLIRKVTERYSRERGVSPVVICDCVWLLSRNLCRNNPGNSGHVIDLKRKSISREKKEKALADIDLLFSIEDFKQTVLAPTEEEIKATETYRGRKRYLGLRHQTSALHSDKLARRKEKSCGRCPVEDTCRFRISAGAYYRGGQLLPEGFQIKLSKRQHDFLVHQDFHATYSARIRKGARFATISFEQAAEENRIAIEKQKQNAR